MSRPRIQHAQRDQTAIRFLALDEMLPPDHVARTVWQFALHIDLTPLYDRIKAVVGHPGKPPIDPRILFALWLYATLDGVGSARELDRLCVDHMAYLWLCGEVSVNYHTLADFRVQHANWLNELLSESIATLRHQNLVTLNHVALDGMKVRASAGAASFRRQPTLHERLTEAQEQVAALSQQLDDGNAAVSQRQEAARQRAAQEKVERVQKALAQMPALRASREAFKKGTGDQARASTTDSEARIMKMGDNGFRPAYNAQFATDVDSGLVVDVEVVSQGTDNGLLLPCADRIAQRYGVSPEAMLADAGFQSVGDIEQLATEHRTRTYMPVKNANKLRDQGKNPFEPKKGDSVAVGQWRQRMGEPESQELYKSRASSAEWVNAGCRNRGLYQVRVRGVSKVRCCALWQALTHNLMTVVRWVTGSWAAKKS
jgi:transposase